jgi:hypothetical protein
MIGDGLTGRERAVLEHLKQAQTLGSTLREYARAFSLNVNNLYNGKAQLQRKGQWPTAPRDSTDLVPVTVVESAPVAIEPSVCRVRHPAGRVLECERFPEPAWLAELFKS